MDSNKQKALARIKTILPERIKGPLRSLVWHAQDIGQIPREAVGARRNPNAVFLWIPKAAGTSTYTALDKHICTKILELTSLKRRFRNSGLVTFGHMDYSQLVREGLVSDQFDQSAFKFSFSRNPYSRAVSLYFFCRKRKWIADDISFLEFCRRIDQGVHDIGIFNVHELSMCNPQSRWLQGIDPNFVGKVENFDDDLREIFDALNLPAPGRTIVKNTTVHSPYQDYYCAESQEIVTRLYSDDFVRFGYETEL